MLLGHRSKISPLIRFGDRREFTMTYLLSQIANVTVHYLSENGSDKLKCLIYQAY